MQKYSFSGKGASNYAELLKLTVIGAPTLTDADYLD